MGGWVEGEGVKTMGGWVEGEGVKANEILEISVYRREECKIGIWSNSRAAVASAAAAPYSDDDVSDAVYGFDDDVVVDYVDLAEFEGNYCLKKVAAPLRTSSRASTIWRP